MGSHRLTAHGRVAAGLLRSALVLVVAVVALSACRRSEVFMHYEPTDVSGWERKDTLRLDIPPLEAAGNYVTTLHVRTTTSSRYPFTALYIEVAQRWTDSCYVDTVECTFADRETDATGIAVRQYTFPIRTLHRAAADSAHITLRHVMRQTSVSGISDVGVSIDRN